MVFIATECIQTESFGRRIQQAGHAIQCIQLSSTAEQSMQGACKGRLHLCKHLVLIANDASLYVQGLQTDTHPTGQPGRQLHDHLHRNHLTSS